MTSKQIIKLAKIGLAVLQKTAGRIPGVPDGSGPHGRRGAGRGPGQGTHSGLGIIRQKMNNGKRLTKTEQDIYNKYHPDMGKSSGLAPGVPDETGPYGRGAGPGQGTGSGLGMLIDALTQGQEAPVALQRNLQPSIQDLLSYLIDNNMLDPRVLSGLGEEASAKTASKMTKEQIIKLAKIGLVVLSKQTRR